MRELIPRIIDHYFSRGAHICAGVSPSALATFEVDHGFSLPPPMCDLYLAFDGVEGVPDFGYETLQLWPISKLTRVSDGVAAYRGIPDYGRIVNVLPEANEFIAFGDAMCWSHVLAAQMNLDCGPVLWISGESFVVVAPSFAEFWERYLRNPMDVLWPLSRTS